MSDDAATRITARLRRDHPDPAQREALYAAGKLDGYVRALAPELADDDAAITRLVAAVRAAEDGQPGPMT